VLVVYEFNAEADFRTRSAFAVTTIAAIRAARSWRAVETAKSAVADIYARRSLVAVEVAAATTSAGVVARRVGVAVEVTEPVWTAIDARLPCGAGTATTAAVTVDRVSATTRAAACAADTGTSTRAHGTASARATSRTGSAAASATVGARASVGSGPRAASATGGGQAAAGHDGHGRDDVGRTDEPNDVFHTPSLPDLARPCKARETMSAVRLALPTRPPVLPSCRVASTFAGCTFQLRH
jgi:hypothetical protein